jgi:hypothetical protein
VIKTGSSVRVTGRPIIEAIIDALEGLDRNENEEDPNGA